MTGDRVVALEVRAEDAGQRIDALVAGLLEVSHTHARSLCAAGKVRLDGRRVPKGARAAAGAHLTVELGAELVVAPEPELPLDVRLERDDLVVVCKPAGMPSVPLRAGERGTLAGALLARYPEMQTVGYRAREPGVIHRLDTGTSGLMIAARDAASFRRLFDALRAGRLEKRYLAVVAEQGLPDAGSIDRALAPDPRRRGRVAASERGEGRPSTTQFRVLERGARFALLEITVSRAFRHQIRTHLAAIGHPIAGDALYGGAEDVRLAARHALHASYAAWAGDGTPSFAVSDGAPGVFLDLVRGAGEAGSSDT